MKTPDEIKKGLEYCTIMEEECSKCPSGGCPGSPSLHEDALAYIQQLETKSPQWISVEGRLTDKNGKYFVAVDLGVAGSALTFYNRPLAAQ